MNRLRFAPRQGWPAISVRGVVLVAALRACRNIVSMAVSGFALAMVATATAYAQSGPSAYAGTWHGNSVISGPLVCPGSTSADCTTTAPWSGTVDASGLFTYVYGPGGRRCSDGSYTPDARGDLHQVQVPAGGNATLGYFSADCFRYAQFSASPSLTVSSNVNCTIPYPLPDGTTCTQAISASFTGTGVPPVQPGEAARLTGSFGTGAKPVGQYQVSATFTCDFSSGPAGPCSGTGAFAERDENCTNVFQNAGAVSIAGLDLSRAGPFQVVASFNAVDYRTTTRTDGSCAYVLTSPVAKDISFTGVWNGTTGTIAFPPDTDSRGNPINISGSFTVARSPPPPEFPMVVNSNITAATATASAEIRFRAQDVGTSASVYVFAVAPASLVKAAADRSAPFVVGKTMPASGTKDSPLDCVLAQLSPSGEMNSVTPAQLQAYLSGVLSAQGAAVSILNAVATANVAGATFYVGYGAAGAAMIDNGVYRSAVTVPGGSVCPMLSSQTALWWNPAESGWGLNLSHQGNILFGTLFTYDAGHAPLWLVMSNGAMKADAVSFTGELYRTTGPSFDANPFSPIGAANLTQVGTMTVAFQDVNSGTLSYTVNGVDVSKAIQRQVFGTRAAACFPMTGSRVSATNYQDLWWNNAESGWGVNVAHQDNTIFATLFTYDATGKGIWLVMSSGSGRPTVPTWAIFIRRPAPHSIQSRSPVSASLRSGSMRFRFSDGNHGTLSYTYHGTSVTKAITRQEFSTSAPICH